MKRSVSFLIVSVIYLLAAVVGVVCFLLLPFAFWLNLLIADVAATVFTFIFSVIFKNASVYDPYWSVQPIVITLAYLICKPTLSAVVPTVAIFIWGIRLTANWAYTFHGLAHQDWRYTMLKEKTGKLYPIVNFVGIHLVPTLVVYGCVLPVAFLFEYAPSFNPWSVPFIALSLLSTLMQGTADVQMHKFRKQKTGGFIRNGLWKYSRHPNYLGEILTWWGIAFAAFICMTDKWYLLGGAFFNTLLFLFVSIPLADGKLSKRDGFAEYKKQTRALLPIKK